MRYLLLMTLIFTVNNTFAKMMMHKSNLPFMQAQKALELQFKQKGLTIFAKIDHQKAAKEVQLTMNPAIVYIFGNPKVGTLLMNDNIEWAYELPLKIAIYEDDNGNVWLSTRDLAKDIKSTTQKETIKKINSLLKGLIQQ